MLKIAICDDDDRFLDIEENVISQYLKSKYLDAEKAHLIYCGSMFKSNSIFTVPYQYHLSKPAMEKDGAATIFKWGQMAPFLSKAVF